MTAKVFQNILKKGERRGLTPAEDQRSRDWFRNRAQRTLFVNRKRIMNQSDDSLKHNKITIGKMYMFFYDPKHKETLPYYDKFPLCFPIEPYPDGFLGLNLHYLPYRERAALMDALYNNLTDRRYNEKTRVAVDYGILRSSSSLRYFRPCLKRYLWSHVESQFLEIQPKEWDIALFLRVEQFRKQSRGHVWRESRDMI